MGDEQVGQIEFFAFFPSRVEDLGLNGYIQRRGRLIAHDK
jgi:hypothetical protein